MFAELPRSIRRPPQRERHRQAWISPETWSIIGTSIAAHRQKYQRGSRAFRCVIKAGLQEDRRRQAAKAGSAVGYLLALDLPLILEAWIRMRGWYKAAVDRPPPRARVALATMTAEREELYRNVSPPGEPIHVEDLPLLVGDDIPEDEEIAWVVHRLFLKRSGGPSGMRAEHLRQWPIAATQDNSPNATNLQRVVAIT